MLCLAIGLYFGYQFGWSARKTAMENPVLRFVTEGRLF
jgi:hypothetical protein